MEKYDYEEAVRNDIENWLEENGERYADDDGTISYDAVYDDMFIDDSITGNGSGSYTFNTWTAEDNLCHNLDLLRDAIEDFGGDYERAMQSAEGADVTIRCYLLPSLLQEVLDDYNEKHQKTDEEDEENPNESYRGYRTCNSIISEAYNRQRNRR